MPKRKSRALNIVLLPLPELPPVLLFLPSTWIRLPNFSRETVCSSTKRPTPFSLNSFRVSISLLDHMENDGKCPQDKLHLRIFRIDTIRVCSHCMQILWMLLLQHPNRSRKAHSPDLLRIDIQTMYIAYHLSLKSLVERSCMSSMTSRFTSVARACSPLS